MYEKYCNTPGKHPGIGKLCSWLDVSRAAYYKWLNRRPAADELENQMIAQWILEYDEKYNHTLGYRRMRNYINRNHEKNYGIKRIHRLMELLGGGKIRNTAFQAQLYEIHTDNSGKPAEKGFLCQRTQLEMDNRRDRVPDPDGQPQAVFKRYSGSV